MIHRLLALVRRVPRISTVAAGLVGVGTFLALASLLPPAPRAVLPELGSLGPFTATGLSPDGRTLVTSVVVPSVAKAASIEVIWTKAGTAILPDGRLLVTRPAAFGFGVAAGSAPPPPPLATPSSRLVPEGICLWDTHAGTVPPFLGPCRPYSWVFSDNSERFAARVGQWKLRVWNVRTGKLLNEYSCHEKDNDWNLFCLRFSPENDLLIGTEWSDELAFYSAATDTKVHSLEVEGRRDIRGFTDDGLWFHYSGDTLRMFDPLKVKPGGSFSPLPRAEWLEAWNDIRLNPDGSFLVLNWGEGKDVSYRVWDSRTGTHREFGERPTAFSPDGRCLVFAAEEPTLHPLLEWIDEHVFTLVEPQWGLTFKDTLTLAPLARLNDAVSCQFSADGATLAVRGSDTSLRIYDFPLRKPWGRIVAWSLAAAAACFLLLRFVPRLLRRAPKAPSLEANA